MNAEGIREAAIRISIDLKNTVDFRSVELKTGIEELRAMANRPFVEPPDLVPCGLVVDDALVAIAWLPRDAETDIACQLLIEDLQDDMITSLGVAWPPCPSHPHPLFASHASGSAVWVCPEDDEEIAPVGRLASALPPAQ